MTSIWKRGSAKVLKPEIDRVPRTLWRDHYGDVRDLEFEFNMPGSAQSDEYQ